MGLAPTGLIVEVMSTLVEECLRITLYVLATSGQLVLLTPEDQTSLLTLVVTYH
jgi:hypothetical protein